MRFPTRDHADRRVADIVERLDFVIARRLDELPDTLVASLHAAGVACGRRTSAHALRRLLQHPVSGAPG